MFALVLLGAGCSRTEPVAERSVTTLEIATVSFPGRLWDPFLPPLESGTATTIEGTLTIPATDRPAPAVIVVHGCGSPGAGERDWVRDLEAAGIATLLLDTFQGRGVSEVCSGRETLNVADLIVDLYRSVEALEDQPGVDATRVAVLGFSFGGRTALWSALERFQDAYDGRPLAGYVAFYPSTCFIRLEADTEVAGGPIRVFHGTADDYTPIGPCQAYIDRLAGAGVDAVIHAYPGAHHSFDNRTLGPSGVHFSPSIPSPRNCAFVERDGEIVDPDTGSVAGVDSACVEYGVRYAYDPDSREHAHSDLLAFLAGIFDT